MAITSKVYDEAKSYALAVLTPYVGQRFWCGSEMYMVCSVTKQHKVSMSRVVTGGSQALWDELVPFNDLWQRLNTGAMKPWRGNALRHSANLRDCVFR